MNRIKTYIAPTEGERAKKLALAVMDDPRFEPLEVNAEIPLDVQFRIDCEKSVCFEDSIGCQAFPTTTVTKIFNAEFKEVSDYVASALAPQGHLYMQLLAAREAGHPCIVVVLGGDNQVADACYQSLKTRYHGDELKYELESYKKRLQDFEARCLANGCPVMRWQIDPFSRLLSTAHKVLCENTMLDYRPKPAEGERELVAACGLTKGIGPETWRNILVEYQLGLFPRGDYAKPIEEMAGIGKKRAAQISPLIRMVYANRVRA
ncbi:MAG: hypothetical protein PHS46_07940 [Candidatus Omnitrophica bacterium]|nr:hypothetical protein [Candidatus Omnitrophota bacterium]